MRNKPGIIQVLLLLLVLSVIAASSVSIMAQQAKFKRELTYLNANPSPRPSPSLPPAFVKGPCYPVGDIDNDGVLKANDATAILNYVAKVKQPTFYTNRADVNKDGKITAVDAQLIQQYLAGTIKTFAACSK